MRKVYNPPAGGVSWPLTVLGALLGTLCVFLVLPFTQLISSGAKRSLEIMRIDTASPPPPPPPEMETPPPPEPEEAEPPPELSEQSMPYRWAIWIWMSALEAEEPSAAALPLAAAGKRLRKWRSSTLPIWISAPGRSPKSNRAILLK